LNRAILAGSVIVGIAVMMSIYMIAPAFASPPWKDVYRCVIVDDPPFVEGAYYYLKTYEPCTSEPDLQKCITKRGTDGHYEFKDLNPYNGAKDPGEQTRCHKN